MLTVDELKKKKVAVKACACLHRTPNARPSPKKRNISTIKDRKDVYVYMRVYYIILGVRTCYSVSDVGCSNMVSASTRYWTATRRMWPQALSLSLTETGSSRGALYGHGRVNVAYANQGRA